MQTRSHPNALFLLLLVIVATAATAAEAQVQPEVAKRYFEEATKLCERDAGRLWAPSFSTYADGPVTWGGLRWFAFPLYMLPEQAADVRQQVILHGLFHRIQPELGLITENGVNEHLDTLEGRVWLQLEWRALRRAVESSGSDRAEAIADALAFRRERRRRFPGAAEGERREEIREGLPSYTGVAAWANSPADAHRAAATALAGGESQTSFVGNFEAASGPGYGVLLDDLLPGWRRQVRATSDLGDMLAAAANRPPTTDVAVAAARYDGATLRTAEEARDRAQQVRVAELRRRFVDGPVLTMPAAGSGTSDTTGSVVIPGVGTVFFRNFTRSARWGRLDANDGVLRSTDETTLTVAVTGPLEGTNLRGDGWTVTLNSGWVVRPAARPGSFVIVREQVPLAVVADPPADKEFPAGLAVVSFPSRGVDLDATLYLPSGPGLHGAVVLLHGLPGYEVNGDLAQSIRRAGWNVLLFHYRGMWGAGGTFSLSSAIEDTAEAVRFLRDPAIATKYRIDLRRFVLIGHSFGGFLAGYEGSRNTDVAGIAMLSAVNLGTLNTDPQEREIRLRRWDMQLRPVPGVTAAALFSEAARHATDWDYVRWAGALRGRPVLIVTADDQNRADMEGLAAALRKTGSATLQHAAVQSDHSFSDHRIALQTIVLRWLESLASERR